MKKNRIKIRRKWEIDPATKREKDRKNEYDRSREKKEFQEELDELENEDFDDYLSSAG